MFWKSNDRTKRDDQHMAKQPTAAGIMDSSVSTGEQLLRDSDTAQIRRRRNLQVAVPQMDREHLELHAQEIAFSAAVIAGAPRAELFIRATWLLEDFQSHFESEECLMRSNNFPGLEPHIEEHRKLTEQMNGLRDDIGSGVISRCDALAVFVRLWVEQHLAGPDTSFVNFLDEQKARCGASLIPTVQ
jgi:hemerythrin